MNRARLTIVATVTAAAIAVPAAYATVTANSTVTLCATGSSLSYSNDGNCAPGATRLSVASGDALDALSSRLGELDGRVAELETARGRLDEAVDVLVYPSVDGFASGQDGVLYTVDVYGQHLKPGTEVVITTSAGDLLPAIPVTADGAPVATTLHVECGTDLSLTATSVLDEPVTSETIAPC